MRKGLHVDGAVSGGWGERVCSASVALTSVLYLPEL